MNVYNQCQSWYNTYFVEVSGKVLEQIVYMYFFMMMKNSQIGSYIINADYSE